MKKDADLAHRFSEACVRTSLALFAFSALAIALSERFQVGTQFEAYGNFEIARDLLQQRLDDLRQDPCWSAYRASLPTSVDPSTTTIATLRETSCAADGSGAVRLYSRSVATVSAQSASAQTTTVSSQTPASGHVKAAPMPPTGLQLVWTLETVDPIEQSLLKLWDDKTLAIGARYSTVAAEEISNWKTYRYHLQNKRPVPAVKNMKSGDPRHPFMGLQLDDIDAIAKLSHTSTADLDRAVHENFRAMIPSTPIDVRLGTAAQVVATGMAILMVVFTAYVRDAANHGALSVPGTIFHALRRSYVSEIAACIAILLPAMSLLILALSIGWRSATSIVLTVSGAAVLIATAATLKQLAPQSLLAEAFHRMQ